VYCERSAFEASAPARSAAVRLISERELPGSTRLTRTPSGAISAASVSPNASIACLLTLYAPSPGAERIPASELIVTMQPFAATISGLKARATR
jgi:hypothetical protein